MELSLIWMIITVFSTAILSGHLLHTFVYHGMPGLSDIVLAGTSFELTSAADERVEPDLCGSYASAPFALVWGALVLGMLCGE